MKKIHYGKLFYGIFASIIVGCISSVYAAKDLGYIEMRFCNGQKHLMETLVSGENNHDICMNFINNGSEKLTFQIEVVEGQVAYGAHVTQACDTSPNGYFGKNTIFSGDNVLTLSPTQTVTKHALYSVPSGFAGTAHGCIAYRILDAEKEQGSFSIISRKANLIDITVPGEVQSNFHLTPIESVPGNIGIAFNQFGKFIGGNKNLKIFYDKNIHSIAALAGLKNDGYADEQYIVRGKIRSFFGLISHVFSGSQAVLYPDQSIVNQLNMHIPRYKGWMSIMWQVDHRPISLSGEQERNWQTISENTYHLFIMPWEMLIIFLIIVSLCIWFFAPEYIKTLLKNKILHVHFLMKQRRRKVK